MRLPRFLLRLPVGFLALALAACATIVSFEEARDSLRDSRNCCESVAQFPYEALAAGKAVSVRLDATSPAFEFPSGKSYFKAFRLPETGFPYRLSVVSFALGESIDKAHVFFPQLVLLDERFAALRRSARADFALGKAGYGETAEATWGLPVKVEGSLRVDDASARYLLVLTTRDLMSETSPYETLAVVPVILPGIVGAVPVGTRTVRIRHSPFGLIRVELARQGASMPP